MFCLLIKAINVESYEAWQKGGNIRSIYHNENKVMFCLLIIERLQSGFEPKSIFNNNKEEFEDG